MGRIQQMLQSRIRWAAKTPLASPSQIIAEMREDLDLPILGMWVGLRLGNFVGGVIGLDKLQYDMWGSDVFVANSCQSNGVWDRICVSQPLKEMLERDLSGSITFSYHKQFTTAKEAVHCSLCEPTEGYYDW